MARRRPPKVPHLETCKTCGRDSYLLNLDGECPLCEIERKERQAERRERPGK